jgi:Zn-dependent protease with chaperone function
MGKGDTLRKLGGFFLIVGLGILIGWGLYWFFGLAFLELPLALKIAIAAIVVGLILLLASLARERYRASKEEKDKFKEVEK